MAGERGLGFRAWSGVRAEGRGCWGTSSRGGCWRASLEESGLLEGEEQVGGSEVRGCSSEEERGVELH